TLPAAARSPAATEPPAIAPEQASNDRQAAAPVPAQPAPPPAAAAAEEKASTVSGPMPTLQLLLAAIALLGLLASVGLFVMSALRRRNDVLNRWQDTAALPFEESPETAAEEAPPYQPVAAHDPTPRPRADASARRRRRDPASPRPPAARCVEHDPEKWAPVFGKDHLITLIRARRRCAAIAPPHR